MMDEERNIEKLVQHRRANAMHIHFPLSADNGGPPCKRCLATWRLSLLITSRKNDIKRLEKSKVIIKENHPKCSMCGILFGGLHQEYPTKLSTGELVCSSCFMAQREVTDA